MKAAAREKLRQLLSGSQHGDGQKDVVSLYELLCQQEGLTAEDRAGFFCELFDHLTYFDVSAVQIPVSVLRVVPRPLAERHCVIPIGVYAGTLTVAMANPLDLAASDEIESAANLDIIVLVSTAEQIHAALQANHLRLEAEERDQVRRREFAASEQEMQKAVGGDEEVTKLSAENEEDIVRLVELVLSNAIHRGASDIHLEPFEKEFKLRYRQDGKLIPIFKGDRGVYSPLVSRIEIMSNLDIAEHRIPQDGRLKIKFENRDIDFRVSILPTYHGEKVVMRILDKESLKLEFTQLGFEEHERDMFIEAISKPNGICLVTGPTGSGKSTTLYSALNNLNDEETNLITLEDPVEYNIYGINQVQCNAKVGLTFGSGLRSILRQDPDVIMVGEIRDQETADIAVKAALTGHLVLSTLHTNDAPGAVSRLLDMGLEPFMLAASLNLCQAQRLVRKLCPKCKKPVKAPKTFLDRYREHLPKDIPTTTAYQGEGCSHCGGTGHKGRTSVVEMMPVTPNLKDMIADGATIAQLTKQARQEGMVTLLQNGLKKVFNGVTSIEEVVRVTAG